jgi:hypothetical protein
VFIFIIPFTFKVEIVDNVKHYRQVLEDGLDHVFPSRIPCLGTIHTSRIKKPRIKSIIIVIEFVFTQLDLFLVH